MVDYDRAAQNRFARMKIICHHLLTLTNVLSHMQLIPLVLPMPSRAHAVLQSERKCPGENKIILNLFLGRKDLFSFFMCLRALLPPLRSLARHLLCCPSNTTPFRLNKHSTLRFSQFFCLETKSMPVNMNLSVCFAFFVAFSFLK